MIMDKKIGKTVRLQGNVKLLQNGLWFAVIVMANKKVGGLHITNPTHTAPCDAPDLCQLSF